MYLVDTDVISERRRGGTCDPGVRGFFATAHSAGTPLYLSVVTICELRQGVERIRHRGDDRQAQRLERWLEQTCSDFADSILAIDLEIADLWGRLRVPDHENPLDKQIAATALMYGLIVVTRNTAHFAPTGVAVLNPFGA